MCVLRHDTFPFLTTSYSELFITGYSMLLVVPELTTTDITLLVVPELTTTDITLLVVSELTTTDIHHVACCA